MQNHLLSRLQDFNRENVQRKLFGYRKFLIKKALLKGFFKKLGPAMWVLKIQLPDLYSLKKCFSKHF